MGAKYVFNPLTGNLDTTDVVAFNGEVNLGTAAAPSVFFTGDTNTGIYSPGADQVAISTNGTQRLLIEADGDINIDSGGVFYDATNNRLAIGTTSPQQPLHIKNAVSSACRLVLENTGSSSPASTQVWSQNNDLVFDANGGEAVRIDSARRLLVGMSSDSGNTTLVLQGNSAGATGTPTIAFKRNILPAVNNDIAIISFSNVTGGEGARLQVEADGAWTNGSSHPTRLVFSVTADGASSPTEAMRIKNTRVINFSNAPVYADNAAAKTGGLVDGDVYRTSTGDLKIVYT